MKKLICLLLSCILFIPLLSWITNASPNIKDIIWNIDITECTWDKVEKSLQIEEWSYLHKCYQFKNNTETSITISLYFADSFTQKDWNIWCRNETDLKSPFVNNISIYDTYSNTYVDKITYNLKPKEILKRKVNYAFPDSANTWEQIRYCFLTDFWSKSQQQLGVNIDNEDSEKITGSFDIKVRKAKLLSAELVTAWALTKGDITDESTDESIDKTTDTNISLDSAPQEKQADSKQETPSNDKIITLLICQILLLVFLLFFYFKKKQYCIPLPTKKTSRKTTTTARKTRTTTKK